MADKISRYLVPEEMTIHGFKTIMNQFITDLLRKQDFHNSIINAEFDYFFTKLDKTYLYGWDIKSENGWPVRVGGNYTEVILQKNESVEQCISKFLRPNNEYTVIFHSESDHAITLQVAGDTTDIFELDNQALDASHTILDRMEKTITDVGVRETVVKFKTNAESLSENVCVKVISKHNDNKVKLYKMTLFRGPLEFNGLTDAHPLLHNMRYVNNNWEFTNDHRFWEPMNRVINYLNQQFVLSEHSYIVPEFFEISEGGELIVEENGVFTVI